jgi:uncharacterized pyridoxamine 5'-phosphate oxidase family protein
MKQMLKHAQRILDECREDHLHPANDRRHPSHRQALAAIVALEEKIMALTDRDRPLKKDMKTKLKKVNLSLHEDDQTDL